MFCYSAVSIVLLASLLIVGVLGCNKQCSNKEGSESSREPVDERKLIPEVIQVVNDLCEQVSKDENALCNQTATIPPGLVTDQRINVTLMYTDIQLVNKDNELHQNKGRVTTSVTFSYGNFSVIVDDGESKIIMNSTDNEFEVTFTMKLSNRGSVEECFFEWNNIQIKKFAFSTTSIGPNEKTGPIIAKFQKEKLQEILNAKPFLEFMNKEVSICNEKSFLRDIAGTSIVIMIFKSLGSAISNMFNNMFCT